jgi:hypothetical protein
VSGLEMALRFELNKINELNNKIFPTHAPEGDKGPYLVYISSEHPLKTLEGITLDNKADVLFNIFASSYKEMWILRKAVKEKIKTFPLRCIGDGGVYCKDLTINNITATFEHELGLHRGIIDFQIFYKGES